MSNVTIEEAQARLLQLIDQLKSGEEVVITKNSLPVARLIAAESAAIQVRQLGTLHGTVTYMAPDFDAPLEDFREYME